MIPSGTAGRFFSWRIESVLIHFISGHSTPERVKKLFMLVSFFTFMYSLYSIVFITTYPLHRAILALQLDWIPEKSWTFFLIPDGSIMIIMIKANTRRIDRNRNNSCTKTTNKNKCEINAWRIYKHHTRSFFNSMWNGKKRQLLIFLFQLRSNIICFSIQFL